MSRIVLALWVLVAAGAAPAPVDPRVPARHRVPVPLVTIIEKGSTAVFVMGSTDGELKVQPSMDHSDYATADEQPAHEVKLTVPYAMSRHEVTNGLFCEVMNWAIAKGYAVIADGDVKGKNGVMYLGIAHLFEDELLGVQHGIAVAGNRLNPKPHCQDHPVHAVTWYGAAAFCNFLSEACGFAPVYNLADWSWDLSKNGYRLPTEAEWEYAARKDKRWAFAWGNEIDDTHLNYWESKRYRPFNMITTPVGFYDGTKKWGIQTHDNSSPFGLADMTGNVWEWCWDWYGRNYYRCVPARDPRGPERGDDRPPYHVKEATKVWRGCGWAGNDAFSRVAKRWSAAPGLAVNEVGFRIARTL